MQRPPAIRRLATRGSLLIVALLLVGATVAAGCGGADAPATDTVQATTTAPPTVSERPEPPTTRAQTETATTGRTVTLYFADAAATTLIEQTRTADAGGTPLRSALVALAQGPDGGGAVPALPPGTTIVGTDVQGDLALVNLSREFASGYPSGGAAAEFAVLAPLVYTATAVDGIERIRVTVDGQVPQLAGSQYDWTRAFSRADFPDLDEPAP